MMIGMRKNEFNMRLPGKLPRTNPNAARLPSVTDTRVVKIATWKLFQVALIQRGLVKYASNHWSEKPGGGNFSVKLVENEIGTTMKFGKIRKNSVSPTTP